MTWKTAGELVWEMVARLERKGLGTVADAAPSQARAGRFSAGQTVDGGSRVVGIRGRAFLCFVGHSEERVRHQLGLLRDSTSMFPRISAQDAGGCAPPVVLVIVYHLRALKK